MGLAGFQIYSLKASFLFNAWFNQICFKALQIFQLICPSPTQTFLFRLSSGLQNAQEVGSSLQKLSLSTLPCCQHCPMWQMLPHDFAVHFLQIAVDYFIRFVHTISIFLGSYFTLFNFCQHQRVQDRIDGDGQLFGR